ncbi:C-C motif chemokine 19a.2 [Melanotaenia boesemani]|uniref:C-C motif chemokine 19a.2 n=1 Tax=Melanotaenia boesemani TaxID=1250792 RepID=UPI001C03E122|nr:C-C motif chemokine 19a.2 [Melanotaenia boesemani]
MASRVAALILLGVICLGLAAAEMPVDCCLRVSDKRLRATNLVSYIIQEEGKGCAISATVFLTKTGKTLCVVPAKDYPWVQRTIAILNAKAKAQ